MSFLLKDQAYDKLIRRINAGELQYGKTYSLNALAQTLEMSRTPVRDAIQKLADENRIDVLPSRGIRLHRMTEEEITQHYHFSTAIEGYCAANLADSREKASKLAYLQRMKELLAGMKALEQGQDQPGEFSALDQQFHRELINSLEDPYFSSLQNSPMGFYSHPELHQFTEKISRQDICRCHEAILEAICAGDAPEAYRQVMAHARLMYQVL